MMKLLGRASDALRHRLRPPGSGRLGEDIAHRYLRRHGLTIVARNYRPRSGGGEIDLVAWHRGVLIFVEVKTRATAEFGAPERAIDAEKERFLRRAARDYARRAGVDWQMTRFDIVSVVLSDPPLIEWYPDAFAR